MRSFNSDKEIEIRITELQEALGEYEIVQDDITDLVSHQIRIWELISEIGDSYRKSLFLDELLAVSKMSKIEELKGRKFKLDNSNIEAVDKLDLLSKLETRLNAFKEIEYNDDLASLGTYARIVRKLESL